MYFNGLFLKTIQQGVKAVLDRGRNGGDRFAILKNLIAWIGISLYKNTF